MSELAKTLMVGFHLLAGECSSDELGNVLRISRSTLMRYLEDLRHMGCEIESVKRQQWYCYRLNNKHAVEARLCAWLDLELSRRLT